jgi:hypothetical protein
MRNPLALLLDSHALARYPSFVLDGYAAWVWQRRAKAAMATKTAWQTRRKR